MGMSDSLSVGSVQSWMDETSQLACEGCGFGSFIVVDVLYDESVGGGVISPYWMELECEGCGVVFEHGLTADAVEMIREGY